MRVDKISISLDAGLGDAVRQAARRDDKGLSAWLAEAARAKLRAEALGAFLDAGSGSMARSPSRNCAAPRPSWGSRGGPLRVSALVLDAGAFIAVDRDDRTMIARLRAAEQHAIGLRTSAIVVAQVWRDPAGRQARLARLLRAVDIRAVDDRLARDAGVLLGRAGSADPIDATVVLVAESGDRILTSDPGDLRRLADTAGARVDVVPC